MTRDEAIRKIRESASLGSSTPIFEADREVELARLTTDLVASAIEPVSAVILGVAHSEAGLNELLAREVPLVIARSEDNWLGYLPVAQEFFLAYGPDPSHLNALGFHSADALAEWRG